MRRPACLMLLVSLALGGCAPTFVGPGVSHSMVATETARLQQMDRRAVGREIASTPMLSPWEVEAVAQQIFAAAQPLCAQEQVTCAVDLVVAHEPEENAFMDGNGQLTVTTGLLQLIRSPDELAFIMGHEVGHHIADHVDETMTRARVGQVAGLLLGITAIALTAHADPDFLRNNPDIAALGVAGAVNVGGRVGARAFSQSQELEADYLGFLITRQAGFRPEAGIEAFEALSLATRGQQDGTSFFGTHPGFGERIAHLRQAIAAEQAPASGAH